MGDTQSIYDEEDHQIENDQNNSFLLSDMNFPSFNPSSSQSLHSTSSSNSSQNNNNDNLNQNQSLPMRAYIDKSCDSLVRSLHLKFFHIFLLPSLFYMIFDTFLEFHPLLILQFSPTIYPKMKLG